MSENKNDALDSILESMTSDEEMEKKIDEFAKNKQRNLRIQRARQTSRQFQETYSNSQAKGDEAGQTQEGSIPDFVNKSPQSEPVVLSAADLETDHSGNTLNPQQPQEPAPEDDSQATRVFDTANVNAQADEETGKTVVVSNAEIQNLLEKDEPILKREYLEEEPEEEKEEVKEVYAKKKKKPINWKLWVGVIIAAILCLGAFGIYSFVSSGLSSNKTEQTETAGYSKLLSWAQGYGDLSESDQKNITAYKTIYDKLTDDEKRSINELLQNATGKTFDELLAAATEAAKPDSTNDNTANAEKKAELKAQISSLQSDVDSLERDLTSAQNSYNSARTDYDNKNAALATATSALEDANNKVTSLNSELTGLQSDETSLKAQITTMQNQIDSLDPEEDADKIEEYTSKKTELENTLSTNQARQVAIVQTDLPAANSAVTSAQNSKDSAQNAADAAYNSMVAAQNNVTNIQNQIDSKNTEISNLQSQYNAIQ